MLLPGENSPKTWLFLTILVSSIITFSETSGSKTLDIKLGFDLTQGKDGAPSLRIRDFEDSTEYNPRAVDDASSSDDSGSSIIKKTSPRGLDTSESDEHVRSKNGGSSKEPVKSAKSGSSSDDDDDKTSTSREGTLRSTRGLNAGDFEPEEENPKIHARYQKNSASDAIDSDDSKSRRRYRRHIRKFE